MTKSMMRTIIGGAAAAAIFLAAGAADSGGPFPAKRPGFSGPGVPAFAPWLGDYCNVGVTTGAGRTDIPKLLAALEEIGARDYLHLVWKESSYPGGWEDFGRLAAGMSKAGRRLWLYITPPSEGEPEPFGGDYVKWAEECARIAKAQPSVAGLCIDDFDGNKEKFTPAYCQEMMAAAHAIAPRLAFLVICYFSGGEEAVREHVAQGVVDGVIFPYFLPHRDHSDTSFLRPQLEAARAWLDGTTRAGGRTGSMPLVLMVYAMKHSQSKDEPAPAFVRTCLEIGVQATRDGLIDGVTTYGLPKNNPAFKAAVAAVYKPLAGGKRP